MNYNYNAADIAEMRRHAHNTINDVNRAMNTKAARNPVMRERLMKMYNNATNVIKTADEMERANATRQEYNYDRANDRLNAYMDAIDKIIPELANMDDENRFRRDGFRDQRFNYPRRRGGRRNEANGNNNTNYTNTADDYNDAVNEAADHIANAMTNAFDRAARNMTNAFDRAARNMTNNTTLPTMTGNNSQNNADNRNYNDNRGDYNNNRNDNRNDTTHNRFNTDDDNVGIRR